MFSQVNADRTIADRKDYWLVFYLGVLAEAAVEDDYVESTRLTATMHGETIGTNTLDWKRPNPMWGVQDGNAIFEWSQPIMMQPSVDGMIDCRIEAKLHSQEGWLPVSGSAYCRITCRRMPELEERWVSPSHFTLRSLFSKPFFAVPDRK
ncbi:MAG: hypothetical protein AAGA92_02895 [Planctomycetota bacterium]